MSFVEATWCLILSIKQVHPTVFITDSYERVVLIVLARLQILQRPNGLTVARGSAERRRPPGQVVRIFSSTVKVGRLVLP